MAFLNIVGAETGDLSELVGVSGNVSVANTSVRTGTYCFSFIGGVATSAKIGKQSANGTHVAIGSVAATYFTFYLRFPSFSANYPVWVQDSAGNNICGVEITAAGAIKIANGALSSSAAAATLSANTYYRIDLLALKNGTCSLTVAGSTVTITGSNFTVDYLNLGGGNSMVFRADDIAISDSAYPGEGQVNILKPNATGTYTAWTDGAGTAPTNVAEVPHDSDTGYITSSTATQAETENLDSAATGGVSGTIGTVKSVVIVRDAGGVSSLNIRTRSNTTDQNTTGVDPGATYTLLAKLNDTDPATSAAWVSGGLDALQVGVLNNNSVAVRCTAIYAMVWSTGTTPQVVTPSTLSLTTTRFAPTARVNKILTPATLALTTNRFAPTAPIGKLFTPAAVGLALTGFAPSVRIGKLVTPGAASLILTAFAPAVLAPVVVRPGPASLVIATFAPVIIATDIPRPVPLSIPLWTKGLYKPMHYPPLRYSPLRFKPPRYRKPF